MLQQALARISPRLGETGAVQQPVQDGEVLEEALFENGLKVELHIALAADVGAVAQEP
ncbi:MAG: hypothetical protein J7M17_02730 [Anaerolineae bacterium]|nr:hypothetical protein [Anaerolineae bacterium]